MKRLFREAWPALAWAAFILGVIFLCDSLWMLFEWVRGMGGEENIDRSALLAQSCTAASKFVGAALALGTLAVIDRYVFDLPEEA